MNAARRDPRRRSGPRAAARLGAARWHVGSVARWPRRAGRGCTSSTCPGTGAVAGPAQARDLAGPREGRASGTCRAEPRCSAGRSAAWSRWNSRAATRGTVARWCWWPRRRNSSPGADWEHGMQPAVLDGFARGLAADYRRTVQNFLALQTRGDEHALATLRLLRASLAGARPARSDARSPPGLGILRNADLRDALPEIALPALVIAGEHDRLTPPGAGRALAAALPHARLARSRSAAATRRSCRTPTRSSGGPAASCAAPRPRAQVSPRDATPVSRSTAARVRRSFGRAAGELRRGRPCCRREFATNCSSGSTWCGSSRRRCWTSAPAPATRRSR